MLRGERLPGHAYYPIRVALFLVGTALLVGGFFADVLIGGNPGFGQSQLVMVAAGVLAAVFSLLPVRWYSRIVLALAATGVVVLAAELGLRASGHFQLKTIFRTHPRYLYELEPGSSKYVHLSRHDGGGSTFVKINSAGYRDDELSQVEHRKRIVVYGDSFIAGMATRFEKTFSEKLQQGMTFTLGMPVDVLNAGVWGYGPDQICMRIDDELPHLKPDMVILGIYAGNDFNDLLRNKLFELDGEGDLRLRHPIISQSLNKRFESAHSSFCLGRLIAKAWERQANLAPRDSSEVRRIDWEKELRKCQKDYREYLADSVVRRLPASRSNSFDVSMTPNSESARYQVQLMAKVLQKIKKTTDNHGVRLVLIIIPFLFDVADEQPMELDGFDEYRRSALTDSMERLADANDILCVNLFAPFHERGAAAMYFRQDLHWNDTGQEFAAQLMLDFIIGERLLQ